ncbi:hypothetical protein [Polymorphobacter fuscus]|uniref:Uncharacterized protein n=1 Tax=Sandarakinorhabdus fusca TaxID=1439888 RepID=A0A7C9KMX1_9SPHN|nr:hypothetical protein [Polymorphobacter fuscus]KAB7644864.1 hypothetical protein F9290_12845 [Polymorphobacter fuscus]MQT18143.1 hypothetical protein [Polymorphobacter fuscus]NJC09461.1 hypothetical protein [Polymorphobacter fuscus]
MTLLGNILGWIARHALVFVLLIAAMAIYGQYRQSAASSNGVSTSIARIESARTELANDIEQMRGKAVTGLDDAQRSSQTAIAARIRVATSERDALLRRQPGSADVLRAPRDAIVAGVRRDLAIERLDQEIAFLQRLRDNVETRGRALSLDNQIADLDRRIAADAANIAALPPAMSPQRYVREGLAVRDLGDVYAERRAANAARRTALIAARRQLGDITALATPELALAALQARLQPLETAAAAQRQVLEASAEREARRWYAKLGIGDLLWPAFWALLAIIVTPFAIRTLFYWVLAPLASLQRPIKLLDTTVPIPLPAERSSVSKTILLAPGQELLVRQGFEQTVSLGGAKATQWLLDARHPISSLVSGLYFLTRIRGGPGDTVTVSATHDAFAEVAVLGLPAGAAAVLQPRAIAGVVQPIGTPLRVTAHWRLGTLNAWLTWQLRFLVFHGPAEIILTGGRGVRVEPALAGRSIGQDQLIGFSAGIAYSTGRTETFIPYLFGREPLLKDRVAAGSGLLIAEEAPMAGRAKRGIRHGLEGAIDAVLKVFGI